METEQALGNAAYGAAQLTTTGAEGGAALLYTLFETMGLKPYQDNLHFSAAHAIIQGAVVVGTLGTAVAAWHAIPALGRATASTIKAAAGLGKIPLQGIGTVLFAKRGSPFKKRENNYQRATAFATSVGLLLSLLGAIFHLPVLANLLGLYMDQPVCGLDKMTDSSMTWRALQYVTCYAIHLAARVNSFHSILYLPNMLYSTGWFSLAETALLTAGFAYLYFVFWLRGKTRAVQEEHKFLQEVTRTE